MVVSVPLHYSWLAGGAEGEQLHAALVKHYAATAADSGFVTVAPLGEVSQSASTHQSIHQPIHP